MNVSDRERSNEITERIIGCAIAVHRELGPGLLESIYESALCCEFENVGLPYERQVAIPIYYKGKPIGEHRLDVIVATAVVVELKAVDKVLPVFEAQLLSYLKMTKKQLGLLINFNVPILKDGIKRMII